jgi:transposase
MLLDPFVPYLRERVAAFPDLTGRRLHRELRERGYTGGYTRLTNLLRDIRPAAAPGFEQRFGGRIRPPTRLASPGRLRAVPH